MDENDFSDENAIKVAKMITDEALTDRLNVRILLADISKKAEDATISFKLFIVKLHHDIEENMTIPRIYEDKIIAMMNKQRHKKLLDETMITSMKLIIEDMAQTPS